MFDCPNCKQPTSRLVIPENGKLCCPSCRPTPTRHRHDINLGQTVDKWEGKDGKIHRITKGKQWEIEHRRIAEDGKTVINSVTGKKPEY